MQRSDLLAGFSIPDMHFSGVTSMTDLWALPRACGKAASIGGKRDRHDVVIGDRLAPFFFATVRVPHHDVATVRGCREQGSIRREGNGLDPFFIPGRRSHCPERLDSPFGR